MSQVADRSETPSSGSTAFDAAELEAFAGVYPDETLALHHRLCDHPLLEMESIIALGKRMPEHLLEYNLGDIGVSQPDETKIPKNNLSIEDTLRNIEACGSWACLHNIEIDPQYSELLMNCLAELEEVVIPRTGKMWKPEAYVFISSPNAVTPFHFDPQYNILMQLKGTKDFAVFPAANEAIVPTEAHENYHFTGLANLPYNEEVAAPFATVHSMGPGDAAYVPLKAPHWVKTGPEVSVSFSITWRSDASDRQRHVYLVNHRLRKLGLNPPRFGRAPLRDRVKSLAFRSFDRVRRVF